MSDDPVFVRTAMKSDLPAVRDLLIETWHETYDAIFGQETVTKITGKWHSIEALERRLSVPVSEFIVADDGKIIHAMAFASQKEKIVTLHQLYVLPRSQNRGIGTDMMQEIFYCFDSAERIRLDVHPKNVGAIGFYKLGGFAEIDTMTIDGPAGIKIPHLVLERPLDM